MDTYVSLSCSAGADGGAMLKMSTAQAETSVPLDHATALRTAATILQCAGVTEATFRDGVLLEGRS